MNTANYLGTNDWRLPTVTDTGGSGCSDYGYTGTDCGWNVDLSTGEMAHMYYSTLGNMPSRNTGGGLTTDLVFQAVAVFERPAQGDITRQQLGDIGVGIGQPVAHGELARRRLVVMVEDVPRGVEEPGHQPAAGTEHTAHFLTRVLVMDLFQFALKMGMVIVLAVCAVRAVGGMEALKEKLQAYRAEQREKVLEKSRKLKDKLDQG